MHIAPSHYLFARLWLGSLALLIGLAVWLPLCAESSTGSTAEPTDASTELMVPNLETDEQMLLPTLPSASPQKAKPTPKGFTCVLPPGVPELSLPSDGEAAPQFDDFPEIVAPPAPVTSAPRNNTAKPSDARPLVVDENPPLTEPAPDPAAATSTPPPPLYANWLSSPRTAREEAKKAGLCWLLAATSTQSGEIGQRSQIMNEDIFLKEEFNQFAMKNLLLCSLDYTNKGGGLPLSPEEARREAALKHVRDFLKIRGLPTVIIFSPEGHEIMRWRGYVPGRADSYMQNLKNVVSAENERFHGSKKRRAELAQKGYRQWTSRYGSQVFARLIEFDARRAQLEDDEGRRFRVDLSQLILPDREIITRRRLGLTTPLNPDSHYDTGTLPLSGYR